MMVIRPAIPGDVWPILADLRDEEILELGALGYTCEDCMRIGFDSGTAFVAFNNAEPVGMFGVIDDIVWGVFTRAIERHPVAFLRASRQFFQRLDKPVYNYVDVRNLRAVEWFRWLGLEIGEPEPYGEHGALFRRVDYRPRNALREAA